MPQDIDSPAHHQQRSEFIRRLVQGPPSEENRTDQCAQSTPRFIIQFWHDLRQLPEDIRTCVGSWARWESRGFSHRLFDERAAKTFIGSSLGGEYEQAFARCYHPAMQADYFRLCYLLVEGGCYVDADDVCVAEDIAWLFDDGRLKLQPLCYDIGSGSMVDASVFLAGDAYDPRWIFYFNNNPLIADRGNPIIERALSKATTKLLDFSDDGVLPEIQATTGPGNLSRTIFEIGAEASLQGELAVLRDWGSVAVSQWPLSHREDARNWRLSNQKRFAPRDA
jgi:hypothetical protein